MEYLGVVRVTQILRILFRMMIHVRFMLPVYLLVRLPLKCKDVALEELEIVFQDVLLWHLVLVMFSLEVE
jgi:hypothetical protein